MNGFTANKHFDRLRERREQVSLTRRHLQHERQETEQNTDWLDQASQLSRLQLLDHLSDGYDREILSIDRALKRIDENRYGICPACHRAIAAKRLEVSPDAEYGGECQELREKLAEA